MNSSIDPRIAKVVETVRSTPSVKVAALASDVGLSHSRLGHLFKDGTGISLTAFLEQNRMERASELLRCTEMRVKEITYLVGYVHESSFVRAFQKNFQCTPTVYRKQRSSC